ncbi:cyclase family protein [Mixta theicola]|uniref:cyclase family protein n=1 Tax=Mixta theicola TaxID=1458355 RepID=UPI00197EC609|nr:cyclase family protein [Mixta theicola]GLR08431.1 hypothetical protein GCM10007905_11500 [Mixta theicola]
MNEKKRIVDLSVDIDPDFWEPQKITRKIVNHKSGADKLGKSYLYFQSVSFLRRLWMKIVKPKKYYIDHRDFPDGMGLSLMTYSLTTHTGTHIDAPYHYGWRSDKNGLQKTVTDIPLSWCYGRGVLLDFSDGNTVIDSDNVQKKLAETGHELMSGDIVLINTGAYKKLGKREYFTDYQAVNISALAWLIERGVRVIGTDAFSFDRPFCDMIADYKRSGNKDVLWPAHFFGRDHEYLQIERLGNLEGLPNATGFKVCCFPVKLKNADAAWSRVVAIID